jgi:hypothetical protein
MAKGKVGLIALEYEDETSEDLLDELEVAINSRRCPQCSCGLIRFKDDDSSGLRCPKCNWSFCLWGSMKGMGFHEYLKLMRSK